MELDMGECFCVLGPLLGHPGSAAVVGLGVLRGPKMELDMGEWGVHGPPPPSKILGARGSLFKPAESPMSSSI